MKEIKKKLLCMLCMILAAGTLFAVLPAKNVQAAEKKGLVYSKTKNEYYYYADNKKVKNTWKTVNNQKYYFDKNGKAYAAPKIDGTNYNIVVKKIKNKYYGFDNKARMVKGLNCTIEGKNYYFSTKTGVYSSTTTKKYRTAAAYQKDAKTIKKLLGTPKKTEKTDSCYKPNGVDMTLYYKKYALMIFHDNKTGKEEVFGMMPL